MVNRRNRTLAKRRNTRGRKLSGGSYYKYNDLRNATPRDFLLSERTGAVGPLQGGRRRRRTKRRSSKNRRGRKGRRTRRAGGPYPARPSTADIIAEMEEAKKRSAASATVTNKKSGRVGGRRRSRTMKKTRGRRQRGGYGGSQTIIPQDIVNIGRSAIHDVSSFSNSFRGVADSASPLPTQDQQANSDYNFVYKPVDIPGIRANAELQVSAL